MRKFKVFGSSLRREIFIFRFVIIFSSVRFYKGFESISNLFILKIVVRI